MKKTTKTVLFTICALAAIAVLVFWFVGNGEVKRNEANDLLGFERLNQPDTDKDGLKDWEEDLWGTDPKNKDTDEDGTSDGEEVANFRNPLEPGPNDSLKAPEQRYASLLKTVVEEKNAPLAEFGQNNSFEPYLEEDLKIINAGASDDLRNYGLQIASALSSLSKARENEAAIMLDVLNNQDESKLTLIENSIKDYENTRQKLLLINVPDSVVPIHLNIINTIKGIIFLLNNMNDVLIEPVAALQSAEVYSQTLNAFYVSVVNLNSYFELNNISFDEKEKIKIYMING